DHAAADEVFYALVKPVHERHGAEFAGRYRDAAGRVVVMWRYADEAELERIQAAVAADPDTLRHRQQRLSAGLHGLDFSEYVLYPTDALSG
ncbi:MAG TPA: hypothetical protein V6D23_02095, partial [Candidatus Obscuribacterales bacterium]